MTEIRTTCPYCGVGCGLVAGEDGRLRGDESHPANHGKLCSKGAALAETLDDGARLLRPVVDGIETSWDAALDHVADRFAATIAEHGPDSVAFYVSGQFLTEDYYVANKLMKGFIGSANIDTNSRLCMASTVAGHVRAFGADVVPGIYEDWDEADLVVLVGSNTAWCHPVLYQRLMAARARRGTRVVVIDPRRTATCEAADLHLLLAIGSDVALFAGLLVHLVDSGAVDRPYIDAHCRGFDEAVAAARASVGSLDGVAAITQLDPAAIRSFYDLFAATTRVLTVFSQGVNQSSAGTDKVNAIINCHLATGRIGRPGMGPFSVTGQPNAMGGREVGGLANQLAAHMKLDDPDGVDRIRRFWQSPGVATRPGLKAVELFEAVADGRIKALWIAATNPAASMPRADLVRRALATCPFMVVADCWETDTTRLADVVLPAAGWSEKDGTVTNSERVISRQRALRPPPGAAKPDWWMFARVAQRLGWASAFAYTRPAEIFREHAALSGFENGGARAFDIGDLATLDDEAYAALDPVRWPVTGGASGGRLFGDGRFVTPDGRASLVATPFRPPAQGANRKQPYLLNTGRIRDQWHTMTRTGSVARLMSHQDEPFLDLNPEDAGRLGVASGDLVRIDTADGSAVLRARPGTGLQPGEIFVPMHWTDAYAGAGPVARLVAGACDPISGQPELKATPARLAPVATLWHGLLLGPAAAIAEADFYWSRIAIAGGALYLLRGWDPLPAGTAVSDWIERLLPRSQRGERLELHDAEQGYRRFVTLAGGRLLSCLLLSAGSQSRLPDRDSVAALLGAPFDASARAVLHAAPSGAAEPSFQRKVCSCHAVTRGSIEAAIKAGRLSSAREIGTALKAGTQCGSCIPELEEILRSVASCVG